MIMETVANCTRSKGDSPQDVSTTEKRETTATSPQQEFRVQRRPPKLTKQSNKHRHMPYDRSPGGSTCTSSDESNGEQEMEDAVCSEQKRLKRAAANCRERKRMHTVNSAFDELRELVPTYPSNRKLSKIDTLRLACAYIEDLTALLRNPAVVHGEDVKLYPQCPDGFVQGCGSPPSTGYPGVQVKNEYGDFNGCSYQQYRVQSVHPAPGYFSDCASDYSPSESETHSPPYFAQTCQSGIGVRPPAFSRTSSDSAVAVQMAQASIGTTVSGQVYHARQLPPNCSPLATVQHTSPALLSTSVPSPPESHAPPLWQRTGSLPYCLYRQ